jgi:hypothetical protein
VIASAIDDALGLPGAVTQLPISPQRLKAIIQNLSFRDGPMGRARNP